MELLIRNSTLRRLPFKIKMLSKHHYIFKKNLSCSSQGTQPCFYSTQKLKFKVVQNTTTLKYKFLNPRSRYDLFKVHQM